MDKHCIMKNVYTKAANILNEINAKACRKWHPEKETVACYTIIPPNAPSSVPVLDIRIFLNGFNDSKNPTYTFIVDNDMFVKFCDMSSSNVPNFYHDISFTDFIKKLENIKNGAYLE